MGDDGMTRFAFGVLFGACTVVVYAALVLAGQMDRDIQQATRWPS